MTLEQQLASVKREIALRRNMYPKWVAIGRMKQETATHELAAMEAVLDTLQRSTGKPPRPPAAVRAEIQNMMLAISRKQLTQEQAMQYIADYCLSANTAADEILRLRRALEQCVRIAQMWHGDEAFDIYFNHAPEMKPIRDVLGEMPEPA